MDYLSIYRIFVLIILGFRKRNYTVDYSMTGAEGGHDWLLLVIGGAVLITVEYSWYSFWVFTFAGEQGDVSFLDDILLLSIVNPFVDFIIYGGFKLHGFTCTGVTPHL